MNLYIVLGPNGKIAVASTEQVDVASFEDSDQYQVITVPFVLPGVRE